MKAEDAKNAKIGRRGMDHDQDQDQDQDSGLDAGDWLGNFISKHRRGGFTPRSHSNHLEAIAA